MKPSIARGIVENGGLLAKDSVLSLVDYMESAERKIEQLIDDFNQAKAGILKAERERDELRAEQAEHGEQIARMESKFSLAKRALDSKTARCEKAEAELRRRDAAAGEPVAWQYRVSAGPQTGWSFWGYGKGREYEKSYQVECRPLYTAAQPAVLPPDITFESKGFISLASEDFAYNRALEDARKLGAQPQKPVICPPVQYLSKYAADDGHCTTGKLVPNKRTELRDTEWREALDAAGVKWEVKK